MGRFSSPLEVVGLFALATVVSVALIYFIDAEAGARKSRGQVLEEGSGGAGGGEVGQRDDGGGSNSSGVGLVGYVRRAVLDLLGGRRRRRSVGEEEGVVVIRMRHGHGHHPVPQPTNNNNNNDERQDEEVRQEVERVMCYDVDDVLVVVGITCCLNFAFVLLVWGVVRWFAVGGGGKRKWGHSHVFVDYHEGEGEGEEDFDVGDGDGWGDEEEEKVVLRRSQSMEELRYVT